MAVEKLLLAKFAKIKSRQEARQSIFSDRVDIFYPPNFDCLRRKGSFSTPTDGMRRPVSGRDAVRSQVIDVLKAQIKRRPAMEKVSTRAAAQSRNISQHRLNRERPICTERTNRSSRVRMEAWRQWPLGKTKALLMKNQNEST